MHHVGKFSFCWHQQKIQDNFGMRNWFYPNKIRKLHLQNRLYYYLLKSQSVIYNDNFKAAVMWSFFLFFLHSPYNYMPCAFLDEG